MALRFSGGSEFAALPAVALTAFYLPLSNWALQGMEVGLLALLLAAAGSRSGAATPYFSHRPCHDLLGRCDRRIAREQARTRTTRRAVLRFVPGHAKWDFDYSVLELQPDLVLHDVSRGERQGELLALYQRRIYTRRNSRQVEWEVLAAAARTPRTPPRPAAQRGW